MALPVMGEAGEHGAAGNERRVDVQLGGAQIPVFLELRETLLFRLVGAAAAWFKEFRLMLRGHSKAGGDGFAKSVTAAL